MYISGLMDGKLEFTFSGPQSFSERGGHEFAFQWFEGSNEEKWLSNRRKRFYSEM